ncbi:hypothetical protein BD414DRAFT_507625 [Trametes punicea]|nr:hypothetical protein BD414DRAFT_507625 [Trametes punicea]
MASRKATPSPKSPTSQRRVGLQDPDTTPTRKRLGVGYVREDIESSSLLLPRRNSWEEEMQVNALPDPRTAEHVSYLDIWKGPYLELSETAAREFLAALEMALADRRKAFRRFYDLLRRNAHDATVELEDILKEGCALFGHHAELVHLFNGMLPPGYRMETHRDYVAIFTPDGGWNELPGGIRVDHPVITSSSC